MDNHSPDKPENKIIETIQEQECENWIVHDDSSREAYYPEATDLPTEPYRLYRFLTDLEDILSNIADDSDRIKAISPLVRHLLTSSYWLQMEYLEPSPKTGWSVKMLYREPDYPLTVQMVAWNPGVVSPIHNHAAWGIVALVSGQERNKFWRRSPTVEFPERLELVGEQILEPGEIIGFMPEAIHSVEPIGDEPTITFNLYGATNFPKRYEYDQIKHTVKNF
jgi:predicted metal-dependent enzyme (double-stranded beta helix superfamily)